MNTLELLLDDDVWTDACREAALRAVDVDALLADVLSERFARWMTADEALDACDPELEHRLAVAAHAAAETAREVGFDASALCRDGRMPPRWAASLAAAIADDVKTRLERLERWQVVFRAGERAALRGLHREAAQRFGEAVDLAGTARLPRSMSLERLARAELVQGHMTAAADAARRAMVLAGQAGLQQTLGLARLARLIAVVATGHPAVQQIVAGLVALDQRDAATAAERLADGARVAADDRQGIFEMRARGALAVLRLSAGASREASAEARRAAALARQATLDDLGGLLDVVASVGDAAAGGPVEDRAPMTDGGQSAGQGSSSSGH